MEGNIVVYCSVTALVDTSVDKVIVGSKVAKVLNVRTGEYLELLLDNEKLVLQSIRCDEEYAFKISYRLNNILKLSGKVFKVRKKKRSRRILDKVTFKLITPSRVNVEQLLEIKRLLIGKTVDLNCLIPLESLNGEVFLLKIVDFKPQVRSGTISSSTLIEISK